ncbi:MAG TPA: LuxR C-terminal-related transcriptional regulator [Acidimicrobiia bacterium]|nr:LuxR C-terminal-related transcriptional regulator [Acidimicrobiia bacterium]
MTSTAYSSVPDTYEGGGEGRGEGVGSARDARDPGARFGVAPRRDAVGARSRPSAIIRHQPTSACDVDLENEVARAGLPVIERLGEDLGDLAIRIELTDAHANVIRRVVGAHSPTSTDGPAGAYVAAPITDPRREIPVGAVGITCSIPDASALTLAYAQLAARTISERMVGSAAVADRVLLEQFLRARRRARGPMLAVSAGELLTNTAAARLVKPGDHIRIWKWAIDTVGSNDDAIGELRVGAEPVNARCKAVRVAGALVGALVHIEDLAPSAKPTVRRSRSIAPPTFGWDSLRPAELGIAELVAEGLTNREIAARIFLSPHTVDSYMRQIYRKLAINSRIELTRIVLARTAGVDDLSETLAG